MAAPGFDCRTCGRRHEQLPFAYAATAPAAWSRRPASVWARRRGVREIGAEHCIVDGRHFVRAVLALPVLEAGRDFEWGVWVGLGAREFARMEALWDVAGREAEPAVHGVLASELPMYRERTDGLPVLVHQRPVGLRPRVEVVPSLHPLSVEQREGVDVDRVRAIAEQLLHAERVRQAA